MSKFSEAFQNVGNSYSLAPDVAVMAHNAASCFGGSHYDLSGAFKLQQQVSNNLVRSAEYINNGMALG